MNIDNKNQYINFINNFWDNNVMPSLKDFIRIPSKSPDFDKDWDKNGYIDKAILLVKKWCEQHSLPNMEIKEMKIEGRTPILYLDIPGSVDKNIFVYGHLDKQPESEGWSPGFGPWLPKVYDNKLYGRGSVDDGYSIYSIMTSLNFLHEYSIPYPRCFILLESCEESGSYDLPFYIDKLKNIIKKPDLCICLDSGCGDYDRLWVTNSLRGMISGDLSVQILREGIHSGTASGIVPSSFRILRILLDRIEDSNTGLIKLDALNCDIPKDRIVEAKKTAGILSSKIYQELPFYESCQPSTKNIEELLINKTWKPTLSVTGAGGLPALKDSGNVLRPYTSVKLSFRIPPTCNAVAAADKIKSLFESNPPYQSTVKFNLNGVSSGWNMENFTDDFSDIIMNSSKYFFDNPAAYIGEGGSIPLISMLQEMFPESKHLVIGLVGPKSNPHGPNEFLHIPMAKKLTCCLSFIIKSL